MSHAKKCIGIDESGSINGKRPCIIVSAFSDDPKDGEPYEFESKERSNRLISPDFKFAYLKEETLQLARRLFDEDNKWNGQCAEYKLRAFTSAVLILESGFEPYYSHVYVDSFCDPEMLRDELVFYLGSLCCTKVPQTAVTCVVGADLRFPITHTADGNANYILKRSRYAPDRKNVITYLDNTLPGKRVEILPRRFSSLYKSCNSIKML
jgi:hypothetical protein